ncbi:hypothetical protein, partial [Vibrio cholerae]|uniref:hypothetical protein n=1 Tax=Vibrio cholerae TaxID=666 RepID=UPI001CA422C3
KPAVATRQARVSLESFILTPCSIISPLKKALSLFFIKKLNINDERKPRIHVQLCNEANKLKASTALFSAG